MSTTVEDISTTKKRLKIEIPSDVIEKEYQSSLSKVKQRAKIPGFRPGKVPVNIIEKKFSGDIKADIIDRLVPEYYSKALKEGNLVPVTMPKFENEVEIRRNEPLSIQLTVEVRPRIDELHYEGLKVNDVPVNVEEQEIDDTLQSVQKERALFDVVEREIKVDDLIVIDYAKLDSTGEKELSSGKDQVMNLDSSVTPQGILEGVVGKKKGDVVELAIPSFKDGKEVPDKDENVSEGSRIRITIKEVKEKRLPELDDEFAKDFGHDTLASLREKIEEGLLQAKKDGAVKEQKAKLRDILVDSHDFDVPETLLDKEMQNLIVNEKFSKKESQELVEEAKTGKEQDAGDETEAAERLKPQAVKSVKAIILLDMIAEKEGITVTEEEMKSKIILLAKQLQTSPETVMNLFMTKDGSLENLRNTIRDDKVLDRILSKAEIIKGD